MIPRDIGLENTSSEHFLTVPLRVTITTYLSESKLVTGRNAWTVLSSGCNDSTLTMLRPFPEAGTSGML